LNLPRGWLKSDDAYMGYRKLAAQDLRLARTINNILRSMATAYTLAGKIILHRTGKWDPTYKVVTTYTPPAPIASEQLAGLRDALDIITQMIDLSGNPDPETGEVKKEPDLVRKLLIKVAKLPATTVDDMLPPGKKTEELTNEQIKQIAIQAFCSSGDEEVTSDKTPLIWYNNENVRNPYQSDRKITTEMIV